MKPLEVAIHVSTLRYKRRVESAAALCGEWLSKCNSPSIAFSGGKDSTVILSIIRSLEPNCPAHYSHPQYELDETRRFIEGVSNLRQYAYKNKHADFFTAWLDGEPISDGVEWFAGKSSAEWVNANGIDGVAVGIRSDENSYRKIAIRRYGSLFYAKKKNIWQCWPIHDWSELDVWAYILSTGIDYNRAYDKMRDAGIPLKDQRIGPFANEKALKVGQLAILRTVFPEQYSRFLKDHPEASLHT